MLTGPISVSPIAASGGGNVVMQADNTIANIKSKPGDWPLFQWLTTLGSVTIVNLSPNPLVIGGLDVVGTPGSVLPLVQLTPNGGGGSEFETAATLQFDVRRTAGTSYVDIEQRSPVAQDLVIAGPINNPLGLTRLVNLNGSITFTASVPAPSRPTSWTCTRRTARSAASAHHCRSTWSDTRRSDRPPVHPPGRCSTRGWWSTRSATCT